MWSLLQLNKYYIIETEIYIQFIVRFFVGKTLGFLSNQDFTDKFWLLGQELKSGTLNLGAQDLDWTRN